MKDLKTAKEITFKYLNELPDNYEFSGMDLFKNLQQHSFHYPSTYLRYLRDYRSKTNREIICLNKRKSLYKIMGDVA